MAANAEWRMVSDSPARTMQIGERLGRGLRAGDVVLLHGELGAGKTCFVRGVARGMGIDPRAVSSPTFVLINEYEKAAGPPRLLHMDAYRLDGPEDLDGLMLDDALTDAALVVEWAERVVEGLPDPALDIAFRHIGDEQRELTVRTADPRWRTTLADLA